MNKFADFQPQARFAIEANEAGVIVDRKSGTITLQEHRLIGRSRETVIPLDRVTRATLTLVDTASLSLATAGQIISSIVAAVKSSSADEQQLMNVLPKGFGGRIEQTGGEGSSSAVEVFCSLPGLREGKDLIAIARQFADTAGFDYWMVYRTPSAGCEVQLSSRPSAHLTRLPALQPAESEQEAGRFISNALSRAQVPPFEPDRFRGDNKLAEWRPGIRVAFRRPLSKAAPIVFPFALCALAGPALWIPGLVFGGHQDSTGLLIVTGIGVIIGVPATLFLGSLLPRKVEFDWSSRALSIRTWFRQSTVPFERIEGLVLKPRRHESSGGESGSTEVSYLGELQALERAQSDKTAFVHKLVCTKYLKHPDQPLREAVPLLLELAGALRVEGHIEDYAFRRR